MKKILYFASAIILFLTVYCSTVARAQDSASFDVAKQKTASISDQLMEVDSRYSTICDNITSYLAKNSITDGDLDKKISNVKVSIQQLRDENAKVTPIIQVSENQQDLTAIKKMFTTNLDLAKSIKSSLLEICDEAQKLNAQKEAKGGISGRQHNSRA